MTVWAVWVCVCECANVRVLCVKINLFILTIFVYLSETKIIFKKNLIYTNWLKCRTHWIRTETPYIYIHFYFPYFPEGRRTVCIVFIYDWFIDRIVFNAVSAYYNSGDYCLKVISFLIFHGVPHDPTFYEIQWNRLLSAKGFWHEQPLPSHPTDVIVYLHMYM